MIIKTPFRRATSLRLATAATAGLALFALAGCSSGSANTGSTAAADGDDVAVTLIIKTQGTSFFQEMADGAEAAADELGVNLTVAAGKVDGDEDTQIQAIENAISRGDQGILITPNGPSVFDAIQKARDAGLYVIALDTVPDPADSVDITFATDNYLAGQLVGQWTAEKLDGGDAVIALLDLFDDKVLTVDYDRDQGFLDGMGIDVADPTVNGDEAPTGSYTGGKGGSYTIVGNLATQGTEEGGRTAAETLLSKNPDINVIYGINEPASYGGYQALEAAGKTEGLITVSIDGSCDGAQYVEDGILQATAQQYPLKMAELGVQAIYDLVTTGTAPQPEDGEDFFNTGVQLITNDPMPGVPSIDVTEGLEVCF
ncbi:substrate-binding domain-containing protein [Herbiconiux sp. KACC 21604]|uniref:substrate-binding domain-containing protein n=1 Tax=unclassified Herbiconiux TaxID=2618217 RepID=UPI001490B1A6|nr:substrate-binding domain-containing protein [Herbiconiux sp. SALV-R1]QJU54731.1 substrate-binding domain-containing protein [Herbiconiux sp. SALV-R1]WPO85836.1 substrate-binding domain-containing protein [Herbiconiux sp. KACC 21604]